MTVAELIEQAIEGEPAEIVVFRHPFDRKVYGYKPGSKKGDLIESVREEIPPELIGAIVCLERLLPHLRYDEEIGKTASFRIWSGSWFLEHCWTLNHSNCGGKVVRFRRVPLVSTTDDPLREWFCQFSAGTDVGIRRG